jgi:hypothetical protein
MAKNLKGSSFKYNFRVLKVNACLQADITWMSRM